jgi:hypothetical protein
VLHVNGDVALAAAVDPAAGGGDGTRFGMSSLTNSSWRSSISALTTPEASVPGISQCSQPWVWEIIVTELPVPPTG